MKTILLTIRRLALIVQVWHLRRVVAARHRENTRLRVRLAFMQCGREVRP